MIRLSGRMTPFVIASRSSAAFLPEKSRPRAAVAADSPACRAPFAACCWRPRALPPALAARLRAALLRVLEPERLLDPERRVVELLDPDLVLDLRAVEPELRELALDLRAPEPEPELRELELDLRAPEPEPELRELELLLRALDPLLRARELDALRELEPRALEPDDLLRDDDPPPLPLFDSAMSILLSCHARCAPHYRMPTTAVT
jgi:hypothetical protein